MLIEQVKGERNLIDSTAIIMKKNKGKNIAVLMSAFNGEKYIAEQIDSILNQKTSTETHLDLFIRNDGSTDSTKQILDMYQNQFCNVYVIDGNNEGYVRSFFELIAIVKLKNSEKYQYYAFADQDDIWDEDKIQVAIDAIENACIEGPALYESTSRVVSEDLKFEKVSQKKTREITFYNTIIQTFGAGHTYVFNNQLLQLIPHPLECDKIYVHDSFINTLASFVGTIIFDNVPHVDYRQHGNNQLGNERFGILSWFFLRMKRIKRGEGKKYANQIKYVYESLGEMMTKEQSFEIKAFLQSQSNVLTRIRYIIHTNLYRQTVFETVMFKALYILGGYKVSIN